MQARAKFPGPLLPAMGNHECTGATASNCGLGNKDGFPANYSAFLEEMLRPIHQALPYYVARIAAADASWSAKLVFIAANAWDSTQARWLEAALSVPTTYTFVVRHEPNEARSAPGTVPSEAIVVQHPLTLEILRACPLVFPPREPHRHRKRRGTARGGEGVRLCDCGQAGGRRPLRGRDRLPHRASRPGLSLCGDAGRAHREGAEARVVTPFRAPC